MHINTSTKKPATHDLSTEFHNFVADIEDLIKEAGTLTGDELNLAKAKLNSRLSAAKESVESLGGEVAEQARHGASAADDYVHHQPWQAIGAGAAVGLLVGFLLARQH